MSDRDQIKKWVNTWEKAGSALSLIKIRELRDKNYYLKNREILNSMLQYAFDHRTIRNDSGLVSLQKFFKQYYLRTLKNSK